MESRERILPVNLISYAESFLKVYRPIGVVSKKEVGECRTPDNAALKSFKLAIKPITLEERNKPSKASYKFALTQMRNSEGKKTPLEQHLYHQ